MDMHIKRGLPAHLLGLTAIAGGLVPVSAAQAQDDPDPAAAPQSEIVVTAQRRSERLQDVPLSITAVTSEALASARVTSSRELAMVVPGLRIDAGGAFVQPTIRGITTTVTSPTAGANVATYVDGVYQSTTIGAIFSLPDVSQVEVLKGPQGTLFGRNATGGAILINSLQPSLTESSGLLSASYGRFDNAVLKGYVSTPLVADKVGISITGLLEHMDGYKHHLLQGGRRTGGEDTMLVRGKVRFIPWEGADFTISGLYAEREDFTGVKNTSHLGNNVARQTLPLSQIASRPWEYSGNEDPYAFSKQWSVSLRGSIEAGPGTITTTTAYVENSGILTSDSDNSALATSYIENPYFANTFQQELVYATEQLGRFRAVGGLFYFRSRGGFDPINVNRFQRTVFTREDTDSYAIFGEVTFDVTDRLSLTGGLRYSYEKQRAFAAVLVGTSARPTSIPQLGEASWDAVTPRVSALYKLTDRTNIYATFSKGFKSGLFNTASFQTAPVEPERVTSYEAGIKSNEIAGITLSLAGFYYDYVDLQQTTIVTQNGISNQQLRNAASSEIYGAEANVAWNPTRALSLTAGVSYLHARYLAFPIAVILVPTGLGGNQQLTADVSGNTMIRSPTWSGNLTARYAVDTSIGELDASGTLFFSTKFYLESNNRIVQPDYALINASVGLKLSGTNVEVRLWGKNLTNRAVLYGANLVPAGDSVNHSPPRTYGAEINFRF